MHLGQRRILLVDNEDHERLTFERHFRDAGWQATTTWSGLEALALLKVRSFDFLLVDDYVADLHVGEFLKQVSLLRPCPRVFVMQAKPAQKQIRFPGASGVWMLVDKTQIDQVIEALGPDLASA